MASSLPSPLAASSVSLCKFKISRFPTKSIPADRPTQPTFPCLAIPPSSSTPCQPSHCAVLLLRPGVLCRPSLDDHHLRLGALQVVRYRLRLNGLGTNPQVPRVFSTGPAQKRLNFRSSALEFSCVIPINVSLISSFKRGACLTFTSATPLTQHPHVIPSCHFAWRRQYILCFVRLLACALGLGERRDSDGRRSALSQTSLQKRRSPASQMCAKHRDVSTGPSPRRVYWHESWAR